MLLRMLFWEHAQRCFRKGFATMSLLSRIPRADTVTRVYLDAVRCERRRGQRVHIAVQVFVHDPLLHWQLSSAKVAKSRGSHHSSSDAGEGEDSGGGFAPERNPNAEQAVGRVQAKLKGLDFGQGEPLSVQGHVDLLLVKAMDPVNLSQMYVGWAAWL